MSASQNGTQLSESFESMSNSYTRHFTYSDQSSSNLTMTLGGDAHWEYDDADGSYDVADRSAGDDTVRNEWYSSDLDGYLIQSNSLNEDGTRTAYMVSPSGYSQTINYAADGRPLSDSWEGPSGTSGTDTYNVGLEMYTTPTEAPFLTKPSLTVRGIAFPSTRPESRAQKTGALRTVEISEANRSSAVRSRTRFCIVPVTSRHGRPLSRPRTAFAKTNTTRRACTFEDVKGR